MDDFLIRFRKVAWLLFRERLRFVASPFFKEVKEKDNAFAKKGNKSSIVETETNVNVNVVGTWDDKFIQKFITYSFRSFRDD